ncbi:DUF4238 domain-containing protein [Janthinobacterium sp. LM6]|uniref:DUF4238 domain-containing protein n=1 Tax=Janthinobacterium sp. LM6 TaxID=1938606 RepID=UPI0015597431|nr:DUF4238 domain-containing protein [Janthinobacterium sp. LM6]
MADNKRHHYVPKFYLRGFSQDKKSINLLHVKSGKKILGVSLKSQCYRDYFYGKEDTHEKALGILEGVAAESLRRMVDARRPPSPHEQDFHTILIFLVVQSFRTGYQVDAVNEMTDKLLKHLLKEEAMAKSPDLDMSKLTISMKNASNMNVKSAFISYPLLIDLHWLLVKAVDDDEFVTSDTPVVFVNPLMGGINGMANVGIACKGLLLLFPLTPRWSLLMFDKAVYEIPKDFGDATSVDALPTDVVQMNYLQAASCYENFYFFRDDLAAEKILAGAKRYRRIRKNTQSVFPGEETEKYRREIIFNSQEGIVMPLSFSFLKIRRQAIRWRTEFIQKKTRPALVVRDPSLFRLHNEYRELQKKGGVMPPIDEFLKSRCEQEKGIDDNGQPQ